jgi:hypothetical protein
MESVSDKRYGDKQNSLDDERVIPVSLPCVKRQNHPVIKTIRNLSELNRNKRRLYLRLDESLFQ